jgi:hypothetical protein
MRIHRYRGYSPCGFASQLFLCPPCLLVFLVVCSWLKVFFFFSIQSGFWESTCYFFIVLCVSVNCYISCLVCVAICVSRSHSLYLKKNVFPCCLLFPNLQRIGPREERGEEESMGPPFSYFPFHLNQIF